MTIIAPLNYYCFDLGHSRGGARQTPGVNLLLECVSSGVENAGTASNGANVGPEAQLQWVCTVTQKHSPFATFSASWASGYQSHLHTVVLGFIDVF